LVTGNKTDKSEGYSINFVSVLSKKMAIVTLSEALLQRLPAKDGIILRDRILSGFCIRIGRRSRTFFIATSAGGRQVRMTLGRWPLISVNEARNLAIPLLQSCRDGQLPNTRLPGKLPTMKDAVIKYCETKKLKESSKERYLSIISTHFPNWQNIFVDKLEGREFSEHCHQFAQTRGAALVEVGRGLIPFRETGARIQSSGFLTMSFKLSSYCRKQHRHWMGSKIIFDQYLQPSPIGKKIKLKK
jgi:hypothetical protein